MRREQQEEEVYCDELRKAQELKTIYDQKEQSIAQLKCYYEHLKRPEKDRAFKQVVHCLNQKLERLPTKLYIGYKKVKGKTIECSEQGAADPGRGRGWRSSCGWPGLTTWPRTTAPCGPGSCTRGPGGTRRRHVQPGDPIYPPLCRG